MKAVKRKRESRKSVVVEPVVEASVPVPAPAPVAIAESVAEKAAAAPEGTVVLSSNASLRDASVLKDSLVALLDSQAAVTIDARAVERIDTATLQLLTAFVHDRAVMQRHCVWMGASEALVDAVRVLGLGEALMLDLGSGEKAA